MLIAKLEKIGVKIEIPAKNATELRNKVRTILKEHPELKIVEVRFDR